MGTRVCDPSITQQRRPCRQARACRYTHTHIHTQPYTHTHTRYTHAHTHTYTCICTHTRMHTRTRVSTLTRTQNEVANAIPPRRMQVRNELASAKTSLDRTRVNWSAWTQRKTSDHMLTHSQTHIYTHTQTDWQPRMLTDD